MPTKPGNNRVLKAALFYRGLGWSVIPCEARGKKPLVKWEPYQHEAATEEEIREWWSNKWPGANIAVVTGSTSGVLVLDVDGEAGAESMKDLPPLGEAPESRTGSGGAHHWFKHPGDGEYRNFTRKLPGLDFRGDGGYVIVPPSIHPNGTEYRWVTFPHTHTPADAPEWLLDMARAPERPETAPVLDGARNTTLTSTAGRLRREGADEAVIAGILHQINKSRCSPPLPDQEVEGIAHSMMRYQPEIGEADRPVTVIDRGKGSLEGPASSGLAPSGLNISQIHHLTDVGNGKRLVARHGRDLRYCHPWGRWLVWDGHRWELDATDEISRRAKDTALSVYYEAATVAGDDDDRRKAIAKHAVRSEGDARIAAMIHMASSEPGIPVGVNEIDADPWLLVVENGTLDLRTGTLREGRREDMITKKAPVKFDPEAKCPTWERYLIRVMDSNMALIDFLQKAVGYSLTGDTREQCLVLLYGEGFNGKSKFINAISDLLGEYATGTPTESLMAKQGDSGINNDIARLKGARFVSAIETEDGKRFSESLIKQLTGGDRVVARFLHKEFFEFMPVFKLWLAVNHKPVIRGTDYAIWRRIRMVPFIVQIPEAEREGDLGDRLKEELSGILNWALDGLALWLETGLKPPEEVKTATQEYRSEMDTLGKWIEECCILSAELEVSTKSLYEAYKTWCEASGEYKMAKKMLGIRLNERGIRSYNGVSNIQMKRGIGLR